MATIDINTKFNAGDRVYINNKKYTNLKFTILYICFDSDNFCYSEYDKTYYYIVSDTNEYLFVNEDNLFLVI